MWAVGTLPCTAVAVVNTPQALLRSMVDDRGLAVKDEGITTHDVNTPVRKPQPFQSTCFFYQVHGATKRAFFLN